MPLERWLPAPIRRMFNAGPARLTIYTGGFNRLAAELGVEGVPSFAALLLSDLTLVTDFPRCSGSRARRSHRGRHAIKPLPHRDAPTLRGADLRTARVAGTRTGRALPRSSNGTNRAARATRSRTCLTESRSSGDAPEQLAVAVAPGSCMTSSRRPASSAGSARDLVLSYAPPCFNACAGIPQTIRSGRVVR